MKLEDIQELWHRDSTIDYTELGTESIRIPQIHDKYLKIFTDERIRLKGVEFELSKMVRIKTEYYSGKMSQEEIAEYGWDFDPFQGLKVLKGEMEYYYEADTDIQKSEDKIQYIKTCIDTVYEIIENVKWRHQTIGNQYSRSPRSRETRQ